MKAKTWVRDSHGLFDYENTTQVKTVSLSFNSNCFLFRHQNKHDVKSYTSKEMAENEEDNKEIAQITLNNSNMPSNLDKYILTTHLDKNMPINNQTLQELQEKIWYVIKTNNNVNSTNINMGYQSKFEYVLKKNDIIKLGRIKFLIRDMNIVDGNYQISEETFKLYQEFE
jgi:hypothetical protein